MEKTEPDDTIKDWRKVTKDMADLMVKECELALSGSIESLSSIVKRADKLIAIYIPICTALVIYVFAGIENHKTIHLFLHDSLFVSSVLCLSLSIAGLICCLKNLRSFLAAGEGTHPDNILRTEYVDNEYKNEEKYVAISLAICDNVKKRIAINSQTAKTKRKLNDISIYLLFAFPVCPIVVYIATWLFVP